MDSKIVKINGSPDPYAGSILFTIVPIVSLRTGQMHAFQVKAGHDNGRRPIELARMWTDAMYGLIAEFQEFGLIKPNRKALFAFSSDELADDECWENLQRVANPSIVLVCVVRQSGTARLELAIKRIASLRAACRAGAGMYLPDVARTDVDTSFVDYLILGRRMVEDAVKEGGPYMGLIETIALYKYRGAKIILGWIGGVPERRLAISAGVEYGEGWLWPRKFGFLQTLNGGVGQEHWSDARGLPVSREEVLR